MVEKTLSNTKSNFFFENRKKKLKKHFNIFVFLITFEYLIFDESCQHNRVSHHNLCANIKPV